MAEPVEARPQINPLGKNILKHTLHQFASEFPLCFLKNIRIINNLCISKIIQISNLSKKHNLVILNEAQHSEESLQKVKYFNFTSSQFPIFLRALKSAIISLHLR